MSDTTTTLNPGTGGDTLDESSALQSDGVTHAKRPRVVIGGDTGFDGTQNDLVQPMMADPGASTMSLPTLPQALVNDSPESGYVAGELRSLSLTNDGRLRVAIPVSHSGAAFFNPDEQQMWGDQQMDITQKSSPWGDW